MDQVCFKIRKDAEILTVKVKVLSDSVFLTGLTQTHLRAISVVFSLFIFTSQRECVFDASIP